MLKSASVMLCSLSFKSVSEDLGGVPSYFICPILQVSHTFYLVNVIFLLTVMFGNWYVILRKDVHFQAFFCVKSLKDGSHLISIKFILNVCFPFIIIKSFQTKLVDFLHRQHL